MSDKKATEIYEPPENQMTIFDVIDTESEISEEQEKELTADLETAFNIEETIKKVAELAVAAAPKIKSKKKNVKKEGAGRSSPKPLKFTVKETYTPFKAAIIERINERDYTYGDLIAFCTERFDGNKTIGSKKAYNYINSLTSGDDLMSSTVSELLEFLNLSALLVEKEKVITEVKKRVTKIANQNNTEVKEENIEGK